MLELLAATLPELRRGLSEGAARTLAYELFEKIGFGAVAVTDRRRVLAFVGAGADHHGAGDRPIRPVFEALAGDRPLLAPLGIRVECGHAACPLGAAAVVPLRLSDGPVGAVVAYATAGRRSTSRSVELLERLGDQLSAQLQLSELTAATTAALQAQMEPHFVFNALNTIASLVRTDPDRARKLVLAFADYVRSKLSRAPELVTLEEELRHVQSYLDLEQARFGDAARRDGRRVAGRAAVRLPPFLVQPLVENAVKHGKVERPLRLIVGARVRRGRLRVTVRDDGRGIAREAIERVLEPGVSESEGTGLGLASVHHRLTAFYGEGVKLRSFPFGTVVRLGCPCREGRASWTTRRRPAPSSGTCSARTRASRSWRRPRARRRRLEAATRLRRRLPRHRDRRRCRASMRRGSFGGAAGPPAIVFVTAHAEYAVDAFAVEAFDYLLKPVDPERLARVVERLEERQTAVAEPRKIPVVAGGRHRADRPGPGPLRPGRG